MPKLLPYRPELLGNAGGVRAVFGGPLSKLNDPGFQLHDARCDASLFFVAEEYAANVTLRPRVQRNSADYNTRNR